MLVGMETKTILMKYIVGIALLTATLGNGILSAQDDKKEDKAGKKMEKAAKKEKKSDKKVEKAIKKENKAN